MACGRLRASLHQRQIVDGDRSLHFDDLRSLSGQGRPADVDIVRYVGVTESRVSQIHSAAVKKLRETLVSSGAFA